MARWHNGTMAQCHNGTMAQWHDDTMARRHYGTTARRHNGTMSQWQDGTMTRWHNGKMVQWQDGTMARWHNGKIKIIFLPFFKLLFLDFQLGHVKNITFSSNSLQTVIKAIFVCVYWLKSFTNYTVTRNFNNFGTDSPKSSFLQGLSFTNSPLLRWFFLFRGHNLANFITSIERKWIKIRVSL